MDERPLRILLTMPAYWPAHGFGGPVAAAREVVRRLVDRGHTVDVLTTTLEDVGRRASPRTRTAMVDGARVTYLGTPLRYRWMGLPPTLPAWLHRVERPDVVHVSGYRDPLSTFVAAWCRRRGTPYVFEPLGMIEARLRKVALKRVLDTTLTRGVARRAEVVIVVSEREADDVVAAGVARERIVVRGLGFPAPEDVPPADGSLRRALGVDAEAPVILYVGRIAVGKGIEHLLDATRTISDAHLALLGPDDRHGASELVAAASAEPTLAGRIHQLPPTDGPPLALYQEATVFVLASAGDSFGLAAAEAAAAGTPVVVTDRCGIASFFGVDEAIIVPDDRTAVVDAIKRVVSDATLRLTLSTGALAAARRNTWERATETQERAYRLAASRTRSTKASTLGS